MKNLSEEKFLDLCVRLDQIGGAAYSGGAGDLSALSEAMGLIKDAYIEKQTSEEITKLTNQIHAIANEVAMHGWDYRPLLRANELLEAYVQVPKKWVASLKTTNAYDDQGRLVEWNNCELIEYEVPEDYKPQTNEVIIIAASRDEAFEKMIAAYCPNDTEIRMTATGYFIIENQ